MMVRARLALLAGFGALVACSIQPQPEPPLDDGGDADADVDSDVDSDTDGDMDTDSGTHTSTGTASETDTGSDTGTDSGTEIECPFDVPCTDADGDGYGVGSSCKGPDCDDTNPLLSSEADCSDPCDLDDGAAGCGCGTSEPVICYPAPKDTVGVGPCRGGLRTCEDGIWTACEGFVQPAPCDPCNEVDDDCDGEMDEDCKL